MIEIRRAQLGDCGFIRRLSVEMVGQGIPEGRDVPTEAVVDMCSQGLVDLEKWVLSKRDFAILIALEQGNPVGFLILEFHHLEESTGEKQSYIFNLAVQPEAWGKYVGHELCRAAAKISHQRGYRYMTSKVTASNERALLTAIKLGFEIERYQLTMACGPEGPLKMPGRAMAERGHAVSRLLRTRKRKIIQDEQESGEKT
jgi:ribosomal protein S18 acetylase RimI-like enzyme